MIYVNPDNFLGCPRVFTDERNREAWRLCKEHVERTLAEARELTNFYIACGVQGSGGFDEVLNVEYVRDSCLN
ncbi:MAG TPA: hypothetical protein VFO86_14295 [Terriglobia bacterium]|nr:hypothetical protein [Terriglobia bacterium]